MKKNHRVAKLVSVGLRTESNASGVRSFPLRSSDPEFICNNAMQVIQSFNSDTGDQWNPGVTSLYMNASKFEEISKSSGTSSIASFFAKKNNTLEKQEQPISERTNEVQHDNVKFYPTKAIDVLKESVEQTKKVETDVKKPFNTCFNSTTTENYKPAGGSYIRDEIDQTIMNELPEDIKNEIEQFLGIPKTTERNKRTSNGIEKYTVSRKTLDADETKSETSDSEKTSDGTGDSRCSKCGRQVAKSNMSEHNDFHFAMDLQKHGEITLNSFETEEPPKKRQKGNISNFFVPKGR